MKPLRALVSSLSWEKKRKHTFIMSEAGIVGLGNPLHCGQVSLFNQNLRWTPVSLLSCAAHALQSRGSEIRSCAFHLIEPPCLGIYTHYPGRLVGAYMLSQEEESLQTGRFRDMTLGC